MSTQISQGKHSPNILFFNLGVGGHYPNYVQYLIEYWSEEKLSGNFYIVVLQEFLEKHERIVTLAESYEEKNIKFVSITAEEEGQLKTKKSKLDKFLSDFQEWKLLCKYASALKATKCSVAIIDRYLVPIAISDRCPCPVSGIYYRPSLHYVKFSNYQPSWKDKLQHFREKFLLSRVMHKKNVKTLFFLDSFAVSYLNEKYQGNAKAIYLPDPVKVYDKSNFELNKIREGIGISPERKIFLLQGVLNDPRRGVKQLLEAIDLLPSNLCQKLCLLLIGEATTLKRSEYNYKIQEICHSKPVEIIARYEFIKERELHQYFNLADAILAPHQRHVGMSGTLILAAAAGKPILSSNYGLIGEVVKQHGLGLTVDATVPGEIAKGLTLLLSKPEKDLCDRVKMEKFARANSTKQFAKVIFENI